MKGGKKGKKKKRKKKKVYKYVFMYAAAHCEKLMWPENCCQSCQVSLQ